MQGRTICGDNLLIVFQDKYEWVLVLCGCGFVLFNNHQDICDFNSSYNLDHEFIKMTAEETQ